MTAFELRVGELNQDYQTFLGTLEHIVRLRLPEHSLLSALRLRPANGSPSLGCHLIGHLTIKTGGFVLHILCAVFRYIIMQELIAYELSLDFGSIH